MTKHDPAAKALVARNRLSDAGLTQTRPRVALLRLLLEGGDRHFTPGELHAEARAADLRIPLATVYNVLNCFSDVGPLRRIIVGPGKTFFDTNTSHHHHFYFESSEQLRSVPARADGLVDLPQDLADIAPERLEVVVRVRPVKKPADRC